MDEEIVSYDVPMREYTLHASYLVPPDQTALLLHSGGKTSSADIFPLRVDRARRGIGTLARDHRGFGKTGGNLVEQFGLRIMKSIMQSESRGWALR